MESLENNVAFISPPICTNSWFLASEHFSPCGFWICKPIPWFHKFSFRDVITLSSLCRPKIMQKRFKLTECLAQKDSNLNNFSLGLLCVCTFQFSIWRIQTVHDDVTFSLSRVPSWESWLYLLGKVIEPCFSAATRYEKNKQWQLTQAGTHT